MKEVKFERLEDGSWDMIKDDPEDPEYEIIISLDMAEGYSKMDNMKKKGWKARPVDPSFDGFILYKVPFKFPKEWENLKGPLYNPERRKS